jgi:DNA-binding XRE family transcriptional regulator
MTPKKRIEHLTELLREQLAGSSVEIDAPARASGTWFVNVDAAGQSFVVEFRPKIGFGLSSTPADGYGEGADEFFPEPAGVVERIAALIRCKQRTEPERVHLLQELREQRKISQLDLASKLGVKQPTVSKIERREDVALSTLRRYVEALGGNLRVTAQFSDGSVEIGLTDETDSRPARSA